MTRLAEILDQMSAVLNDLKTVMDQEQQHLSMGQINGSQLQWITEHVFLPKFTLNLQFNFFL